jgi:NAD(P)-dependent dehydrogenase (short-subunit alcohol dehydrogenase family)
VLRYWRYLPAVDRYHVRRHRSQQRFEAARPGSDGSLAFVRYAVGARTVADGAHKLGRFDAIIHNAGIGYRQVHRVETEPGIPNIFAINVLAPYILTALIERPARLIYVSSGMHRGVRPRIDD